jgi:hypothetical protein
MPPLPVEYAPPVLTIFISRAVSVPSFLTPAFSVIEAGGRLPWLVKVSSRDTNILTGRAVRRASSAAITVCLVSPSLLPKPPPM